MNAFKSRSFLLVWLGQVLSQSGARIYQIMIVWWLLSAVNENAGLWVGAFMVTTALPSLLFMTKIGRVIDRYASKTILISADLTSACLVMAVAGFLKGGIFSLPLALAVGFVGAVMQAFIDPTLNKALTEVVKKEDRETALSILATTQALSNFSGAVLGAVLIDTLGSSGTALLASVAYFVSALASSQAVFRKELQDPFFEAKASPVGDWTPPVAGWTLLKNYPLLKRLMIGFGAINFFATPTLVVLPLYVKKVLLGSASVLGGLEASLWVGLLIGSLVSQFIFPYWNRIRVGVLCLLCFGVFLAVPGATANVFIYKWALGGAGLALGVNNVKFMSLFQDTVDPAMKGRFFALMQGVVGFTFPVAYFLFGALTDLIQIQTICLIQGAGIVLLAFYFVPLIRQSGVAHD